MAFFGPFYLGYLGLYKIAVVFLAITIPVYLLLNLTVIPHGFMLGGGFFLIINMAFISPAVNYAYYLKKIENKESWNPYALG